MALLSLILLAAGAWAVELPPDWRCEKDEEKKYWTGSRLIDSKAGPAWGEKLDKEALSPFIWLVIYQDRDRDVAERRAPINERWKEFLPEEKCAYFKHYSPRAMERSRNFETLANWKQDSGLAKKLSRLSGDELIAAQTAEPLTGWRARFEEMLSWLETLGMEDEGANLERAYGVFLRIGRIKTAFVDFQLASGWFESRARLRFAEALSQRPALDERLKAAGVQPAAAALLDEPAAREFVVADLAEQLSKDWRNARILGDDFERRLGESLKGRLRQREMDAANLKVEEGLRKRAGAEAARKAAEAAVEGVEKDFKNEKLSFDYAADPQLLMGLEEYRQGKARLASELIAQDELRKRFLAMLQEVCRTHYTSIRYKPAVIQTLCGPAPPSVQP